MESLMEFQAGDKSSSIAGHGLTSGSGLLPESVSADYVRLISGEAEERETGSGSLTAATATTEETCRSVVIAATVAL